MPKFRNVSPLGALELPLVGRVVERGEVISVTAAQAKHLAGQTDVWQPVKATTAQTDSDRATADEAVPDPQGAAS